MVTGYDDGAAAASAGTPQFSTLLVNYDVRPPWQVAGVDYAVGIPAGMTLKDPANISQPGVSVDKNSHVITVTGNNISLNGYDFSTNGGWQVNVTGAGNNVTVQNSYFKVGSNNLEPVQAYYGGTVNLLHNTFDGGGANHSENAMFTAGSGATVEYNRFTNVPNDAIDITNNGKFSVKYNLFDSLNDGAGYHTDAIQTYFSAIDSLDVEYNTMYQPASQNASMNSFLRVGDERGNVVNDPVAAYNTIVAAGGASTSATVFDISAGDGVQGSAVLNPSIHDNYIDPTGIDYAVVSPYISDTMNANVYGNVNMKAGGPLLLGAYNSWSNGVPAGPPDAPVITTVKNDGGSQQSLSGTGPAGSTIDLYDQGNLLGTTTASGNGAWSFTTDAPNRGGHGYTASATDVYGNTSALSSVFGSTGSVPSPTVVAVALADDTGLSSSDKITKDQALVGSGASGAVVHFSVDGRAITPTATADAGGAWSYTPTGLADGTHTIVASETNGGVTGSATVNFTLDTSAPTLTEALVQDTVGSATDSAITNPALTGTGLANAAVSFVVDGTAVPTTVTADGSGAWSYTPVGLAPGQHTVVASESDIAGNIGTASLAFALAQSSLAMSVSLAHDTGSSATDRVTSDGTMIGTGAANAVVHFNVDGRAVSATTTADGSGAWTMPSMSLPDGMHNVLASETFNGETGQAGVSFTLDTQSPQVTVQEASNGGALVGSGDPDASVRIRIDGHRHGAVTMADSQGNWTYTPSGLADGQHRVSVSETDAAGNPGRAFLLFTSGQSAGTAASTSDALGSMLRSPADQIPPAATSTTLTGANADPTSSGVGPHAGEGRLGHGHHNSWHA